ncbi:MAG: hypothetical protein EOO16_00350 [Chitinophagaceae bacterium]|nr:MAG: hypothetical protein EOO16_00350 [Chitinophagaceae bacterium]
MNATDVNPDDLSVCDGVKRLFNFLKGRIPTYVVPDFASDRTVRSFADIYIKDIADYYCSDRISRSNWTQHTATTFFKTSQFLRFVCDFEVGNRHDGAIRSESGEMYLCAEWEYDTNSIFKEKGEIEKLYRTASANKHCDAMLFTYKVESEFNGFVEQVYNKWNSFTKKDDQCRLYLLTALFEKDKEQNIRYFTGLRTVVFALEQIELWDDNLL